MKKLIAIMMVLLFTFAFAGSGWNNIFKGTTATQSSIDADYRYPAWDEDNLDRVEVKQSVLDAYNGALFGTLVSIDTAVVLAEASGSGTYSFSATAGQVILIDWLWVESGADSGVS